MKSLDKKTRESINKLSYSQMFELRRCAHIGHPYFQHGEVGDYFETVMKSKELKLKDGEKTQISKQIGWKN